jgi:hypothetical protein
MPDEIRLEWTYEPTDLFEQRTELSIGECTFLIDAGRVVGRAPFKGDAATKGVLWGFCNELHQRLDALFLAAQAYEHRAYMLSVPTNCVRLSPDGDRHSFALAEGCRLKMSLGKIDVPIANAAGNTTVDTRRYRIGRRIALALNAGEHINDPVANSTLRSYAAAVSDPRNELIHLYEIRDTLKTHFGGEHEARESLGISETGWGKLGTLANTDPLQQGRHRGQHLGRLRGATREELTEARAIARMMIEAYLALLERKAVPEPRSRQAHSSSGRRLQLARSR